MLKKLLKYDLKWCFNPLVVFYILMLFCAVIVRIVESLEKSLIVLIIDKVCCGVLIAMMISILINCLMRNWARFVKNVYKDEAYLTHTLPVSKNDIYLSKVLTAIITSLTSFLVITASFAIAVLNKETWLFLKASIEQSAIYFDSSVFSLVFVILITIFFEFLFMMTSGILGIIIGHRSNNLKIVKSIGVGYMVYITLSLLSLGALYVAGLLKPEVMVIFKNMEVSSNALKSMMLVGILVYALYNLIIYFIGNRLLNKGVNVD